MANNVNTNLTQRLFAYIQHRDDLTTAMTEVYKNSLIFVGDQRQIYVPLYNAYVGIGMDNYNAVVNRVSTVEQGLADLKQKSTVGVVTGAYVQRSLLDADGLTAQQLTDNKLGGDILFKGIGNYDEYTGFSYVHNLVYTYSTGEWSMIEQGGINESGRSNDNATSGIRLTYYVNYTPDVVDGVPVSRPSGHRIVIDDTMTWSYMTKAYDYTLNFSRDYTNSRIDTLYHDLLGIGENVMVPVNGKDIIVNNPDGTTSLMAGEIYKWTGAGEPKYNDLNDSGWVLIDDAADVDPTKTYYRKSKDYNNSYNMNIADGIQTLKEVAYILDQITDGALGGVTYVTKDEWNAANGPADGTITEIQDAIVNGKEMAVNSYVAGGVTYWRVISNNDKPTTNTKQYGYYITEANPDNIGIQIAYSIAGNNTAIVDLHDHIELAEAGKTTARSMSYININNLATVSQWSHTNFSKTDTDESLPSATYTGQSAYILGDVISMVRLNLAYTYLVYNSYYEIKSGEDSNGTTYQYYDTVDTWDSFGNNVINDAERKGIFQKVNFENELPTWSDNTYYGYDATGHTMRLTTSEPQNWPTTAQKAVEWADKNNYYWIPGNSNGVKDAAYDNANDDFEKLTVEYYNSNADETYYTKDGDKYVTVANGTVSAANATNYYRKTTKGTAPAFKQHAIIDTANHIATTAWVSSFYQDNQAAITSQIENILEQAKTYTGEEINKLDNNLQYSYAEFDRWIANTGYTGLSGQTPGSTEYNSRRENAFKLYVADVDADANKYESTYYKNVLRSQYISNVVETNGVVEITETNELPTDQLEITNTVWNSYQSNAEYTKITTVTPDWPASAADSLNDADNAIEDVVEQLFTFVYNNGGTPRQIYYHPSEENYPEDGEFTYVKLKSGDTAIQSDYIMDNGGHYQLLSEATDKVEIIAAFNNTSSISAYKRQVYRKQIPFYEVKTSTIKWVSGEDNDTIKYVDLVGGEHEIVIKDSINNLYVKNGGTAKVEYLTGSIVHYDYTCAGGEGQNKVNLNVNITNVEDSTPTNRGFADSYDVKEYIENIFSWVNLSAYVSDTVFQTTAAFYNEFDVDFKVKNYTDTQGGQTAAEKAEAAAQAVVDKVYKDDGKLYYKDGNKYKPLEKSTVDGYIHKLQRLGDGTVCAVNATGAVANSDFYTISNDNATKLTVYTTEQGGPLVNPLNMVATQVHD